MPSSFLDMMIPFDFISSWPTGSRYICNPAPTDTDNDTVVLVEDLEKAKTALVSFGWTVSGEGYGSVKNDDGWFSAKKEIDGVLENLIVMHEQDKFAKWINATELSKKLNLVNKQDRITVFSFVVDGSPLF